MSVIAGGNYNLSDMQADGRALANAALVLRDTTAVIKAKWDRVSAADIATMNPTYASNNGTATEVGQKLKDMLAEVAAMTAALVPVATYDIADSNPLK